MGEPAPRRRALGVDLGKRRIGVALSDAGGVIASPLTVLERSGDPARDHQRLAELASQHDAAVVVVGLPTSLDGSAGPAAQAVQAEVRRMRAVIAVPVETYDERLTTVIADRAMQQAQLGRKARRRRVDKIAAAVMLQGWLDSSGT